MEKEEKGIEQIFFLTLILGLTSNCSLNQFNINEFY
jgi:hypothetical protein